jgi:protein-disulfide isomerase
MVTGSKRRWIVQIGLTALIAVVAVVLVLFYVTSNQKQSKPVAAKAIRVSSEQLVTKPGTDEPKAVLSVYEDFLCPFCRAFEQEFGPTINDLINSGAVAVDYYPVAILDRPENQNYSSRAGAAAYCVADGSTDIFQRFHLALFAQQPSETGPTFPTDAELIETAREAGSTGSVFDCIKDGRHTAMVQGMAESSGIHATPTLRINGEDYEPSTPDALTEKIKAIVG